jgi:hypothetical protein
MHRHLRHCAALRALATGIAAGCGDGGGSRASPFCADLAKRLGGEFAACVDHVADDATWQTITTTADRERPPTAKFFLCKDDPKQDAFLDARGFGPATAAGGRFAGQPWHEVFATLASPGGEPRDYYMGAERKAVGGEIHELAIPGQGCVFLYTLIDTRDWACAERQRVHGRLLAPRCKRAENPMKRLARSTPTRRSSTVRGPSSTVRSQTTRRPRVRTWHGRRRIGTKRPGRKPRPAGMPETESGPAPAWRWSSTRTAECASNRFPTNRPGTASAWLKIRRTCGDRLPSSCVPGRGQDSALVSRCQHMAAGSASSRSLRRMAHYFRAVDLRKGSPPGWSFLGSDRLTLAGVVVEVQTQEHRTSCERRTEPAARPEWRRERRGPEFATPVETSPSVSVEASPILPEIAPSIEFQRTVLDRPDLMRIKAAADREISPHRDATLHSSRARPPNRAVLRMQVERFA